MPFDLLSLLYCQRHLVFFAIIGVAQVELRRACSIHPLAEKLVDIGMRGLFDGLRQIGADNVFPAVHFKVMLDACIKGLVANLVAQHVKDPATFVVRVLVEFAGIIKVVAHEWLVPEIAALEPFAPVRPALVIGLILAVMRFGPHGFRERRETFVQPDVAPVLGGDQIAKPLVAELVRNQVIFAGGIFGSELGMSQRTAVVGCGAGILHAAGDEIIHHCLGIFFPRVFAKLFAE